MTDFYYDYFALRDVDLQTWSDTFSWPVSRELGHRITLDIIGAYIERLEAMGPGFVSDCVLISRVVPVFVVEAITNYLVVERLRREGRFIRHSGKLTLAPQFLQPHAPMFFTPCRLPSAPASGRSSGNFRRFLHSCWLNRMRLWKLPNHLNSNRCVLAFNAENVIFRPHMDYRTDWVRVFSPQEWYGLSRSMSPADRVALEQAAWEFVTFVHSYARDTLDLSLPPTLTDALFVFVRDSLENMAQGYAGLLEHMERVRPGVLFTPTAGNPFTRAASLAARRRGAHVTGFTHGYYTCHSDSPRLAFHEMSTVDAFMGYTPGSVPLFERNLAHHPPARNNRVSVLHENTPIFREQFLAWSKRPLPERIHTIMVLELSLIPEWAGYHCAASMVNYHFYYTLCRRLSDLGYDVVFKRRPKTLGWDGLNIFKNIRGLRVEYRPFEAPGVLDSVDAVVIQYGMSSTLHWSMCTNKPVIYVDSGWEPWYPDVYEKMARRCRVLPCSYDERNRATFSQEDLLAAVTPPPERPDTEYLKDYLFPEGKG